MDYLTSPLRHTSQAQAVDAIYSLMEVKRGGDWSKLSDGQAELLRWLEAE